MFLPDCASFRSCGLPHTVFSRARGNLTTRMLTKPSVRPSRDVTRRNRRIADVRAIVRATKTQPSRARWVATRIDRSQCLGTGNLDGISVLATEPDEAQQRETDSNPVGATSTLRSQLGCSLASTTPVRRACRKKSQRGGLNGRGQRISPVGSRTGSDDLLHQILSCRSRHQHGIPRNRRGRVFRSAGDGAGGFRP